MRKESTVVIGSARYADKLTLRLIATLQASRRLEATEEMLSHERLAREALAKELMQIRLIIEEEDESLISWEVRGSPFSSVQPKRGGVICDLHLLEQLPLQTDRWSHAAR